jgi:hypothetical protein
VLRRVLLWLNSAATKLSTRGQLPELAVSSMRIVTHFKLGHNQNHAVTKLSTTVTCQS